VQLWLVVVGKKIDAVNYDSQQYAAVEVDNVGNFSDLEQVYQRTVYE